MQIASDAFALVFLRGDELTADFARQELGLLAHLFNAFHERSLRRSPTPPLKEQGHQRDHLCRNDGQGARDVRGMRHY